MNDLEKVEMNTAAYGFYGDKNHDREREGFKRGWENRAAYKGPGSNLPVSSAVLTKRELIAKTVLAGIVGNSRIMGGSVEEYVDKAVLFADKLLEKLGS